MVPKYNPPVKDLYTPDSLKEKKMKESVSWNKTLSLYKKMTENNKWIYSYIWSDSVKVAVVIYDRYPKANIHLLVLPLILDFPNKPSKFTNKDLEILKGYHKLCRIIADGISSSHKTKLSIGYHSYPSMDDLHIHIISETKSKSFQFPHFLTIDIIESELETHKDLSTLYEFIKRSKNTEKFFNDVSHDVNNDVIVKKNVVSVVSDVSDNDDDDIEDIFKQIWDMKNEYLSIENFG
jgi:diadenosine tetraphosphate (Ap4A) HIT family hydrolase